MARKLRIDVAYCVELKRIVDIQEACVEFFNQHKYEKFSFLCSDEECRYSRADGVHVIAVNHNRLPAEQVKSPHFRDRDKHADNCYWKELERALNDDSPLDLSPEEVEAENTYRRLGHKLTKLITKFIIPPDGEVNETEGSNIAAELESIRNESNPVIRRKRLRKYVLGLGATATNLEALVTCFDELRSLSELDQPLTVEGNGSFTFRQVFRHVKFGATPTFAVYYGGSRPRIKRYGGKGFVLKFMDQLEQKPITMYISPDDLRRYRPGERMVAMIDKILSNPASKSYVQVWWIGDLENNDKGWSAKFKTLAHVVLRVFDPMPKSPNGQMDETVSGDD